MNSFHMLSILMILSSILTLCKSGRREQCIDGDKVYDDGDIVVYEKFECTGWGAAASAWTSTESVCRNGEIEVEKEDGQCYDNWICCPSGDSAGCVQTEDQCDFNPDKKCYDVDGTEYEDGEVIRDVKHECIGWGAAARSFTITQEICRVSFIVEESFDGLCDTGVCCQYGNFVGCTVPDCTPQPEKTCLFASETYQEGQVIDVLGYSCMGWGAMQSELRVSEAICRGGNLVVEHRSIPCDHEWACCQKGKSAVCAASWQDCDNVQVQGYDTIDAAEAETAHEDDIDAIETDERRSYEAIDEYGKDWSSDSSSSSSSSFSSSSSSFSSSSSSSSSKYGCNVDGVEYENGEVIRDVKHECDSYESTTFAITQEICKKGKVRETTFDGKCDFGVCCQYGDLVGCQEGSCDDSGSGRSCLFTGNEYQDGAVIDILGYSCLGWGAMQSELQISETVCRDGSLVVENRDIPCAHEWACCQVGKSAYCAADWMECDNFSGVEAAGAETAEIEIEEIQENWKRSSSDSSSSSSSSSSSKYGCNVDGVEYENGEVIRDVNHECDSYESTTFAITQEICKKGKVKEATFDGECDFGVCCQYGDLVGCQDSCDNSGSGRSCLFTGNEYQDGAVIDILGYSCLSWAAIQAQLQISEMVCRDGALVVENGDIPCAHEWACCQVGKSAYCAADWTECDNFMSMAESVKEKEDTGSKDMILDVMDVYAIAEFVGDVEGEVTVDENGNIAIDLDVSSLDMSLCGDEDDTSLLYGIYNENNDEKYGDECSVNDMLDPFETTVLCDELQDDEEPLYINCILGDFSGRFGSLSYNEDKKIFLEENLSYTASSGKGDGFCGLRLSPEVVYAKSMVFMCNDDKRTVLFCASFSIKVYDEGKE